jgi:AAA15 family ATPase/GTPase
MIQNISLSKFKGIKEGEVENLSEINIFVGPNNSGKSTILDSIYLLSSAYNTTDPLDNEIVEYVTSKKAGRSSIQSLHYKYKDEKNIQFQIIGKRLQRPINYTFAGNGWIFDGQFNIWFNEDESNKNLEYYRTADNDNKSSNIPIRESVKNLRNVPDLAKNFYKDNRENLSNSIYLHSGIFEVFPKIERKVWENLVFERKDKKVIEKLNSVYNTNIDQLTFVPIDDEYELRVLFSDYSSRIDSMGDGFRYLFSLIAAIEAFDANTLLVEEPENHQHPKTYSKISDILSEYCASQRTQIFLATHSYEMINELIQSANKTEVDISLYHLGLKEGELETRHIETPDVEVLEDLGIDPRRLNEYE